MSFDEQLLFNNLDFQLKQGEKIGLIGRNGSGKTSLLRVIQGSLSLDTGQVFLGKGIKLGYLSQMPISEEMTLIAYCMEAFEDIFLLEEEIISLQFALEKQPHNSELLHTYGEKLDLFEEKNGYAANSKVKGILRGLGFEEEDFSRTIRSLSGGEERRLYLARLLATDVDVLLLDEPTNHLDMQAISWLEIYLSALPSAVVLVTHDREFLDRTIERIYEIEGGKGRWYPGNYSAYTEKKREIYLQEKRSYDNFLKRKKAEEEKLRTFRDRSSLNQKFAARARDREKKIENMEEVEAPLWISRNMNLRFKAAKATGQDILVCENLSKSFDEEPLIDELNFSLYRRDVLGIIGPNGSGKTTLMRILAGKSSPDQGRVVFGPGVDRGFYRQHQEELRTSDDMVSFINNQFPQYNHGQIRSLLAQFLFTGDEVFKSIELLSGGEKARLRLLLLMLEERNLLLLDEPTNHLDIYSKETLEEALLHYEGTIALVSHDRYFLNRVCTRLLILDGENSSLFEGTYREYEASVPVKTQIKASAKKPELQSRTSTVSKPKEDPIEDKLLILEEELQEIELAFLDKELYNDNDKIKQLSIKRDNCLQKIDKLYALWGEEK